MGYSGAGGVVTTVTDSSNHAGLHYTNFTDTSAQPATSSPVFRAIVLSDHEALTFDIPIDQLQLPPGYFVQSVRQDQDQDAPVSQKLQNMIVVFFGQRLCDT
jgi:hypothetical protein